MLLGVGAAVAFSADFVLSKYGGPNGFSLTHTLHIDNAIDQALSQLNSAISHSAADISAYLAAQASGAYNGIQGALGAISGFFNQAESAISRIDPLILDLDGNGIQTTSLAAGRNFDFNGNGSAERMAWVGDGDGFLVRDLNNNNQIDNGGEFFGDRTVLTGSTFATDGFQALAAMDTDSNGVIDKNDADFGTLKILKGDGTLISLEDSGIQSINLDSKSINLVDSDGNTQTAITNFTQDNGTSANIANYILQTNLADTIPTSHIDIPDDIKILPNAAGGGNVVELQQAMALDTSGTLKDLVQDFINETDPANRQAIVNNILMEWTDANSVSSTAHGPNIDSKEVAVLEAFQGKFFNNNSTSFINTNQVLILQNAYQDLQNLLYAQLNAQTHLSALFDQISLRNVSNGEFVNLNAVMSSLDSAITANSTNGQNLLADFMQTMRPLGLQNHSNFIDFYNHFSDMGSNYQWLMNSVNTNIMDGTSSSEAIDGTALADGMRGFAGNDTLISYEGNDYLDGGDGNDYLRGCLGDDTLNGGDGDDYLTDDIGNNSLLGGAGNDTLYAYYYSSNTLVGGIGNDTLMGGSGNSVYVFNTGDGQDEITDAAGQDVIRFGTGTTAENVIFTATASQKLVITFTNSSDTITVNSNFSGQDYGIESFSFSDGTSLSAANILERLQSLGTASDDTIQGSALSESIYGYGGNDYLLSSSGNDTVYAGNGNDTLDGGSGNDLLMGEDGNDYLYSTSGNTTLIGGSGNDTLYGGYDDSHYVFNLGDGQDSISDGSGQDTIHFGSGILIGDLRFMANSNDLIISSATSSDSITISNFFGTGQIESFVFSDNTSITAAQVTDLLKIVGTAGNDSISGTNYSEVIYGNSGDDYISAASGNDTVYGEAGNDTLYGSSGHDLLVGGIDNDYISAGEGDDTLDGGTGNNTLYGEAGNDTYIINSGSTDTIYEAAGYGTDTIESSINYTLNDGIENLVLTGSSGLTGTGNALDNFLLGNSGNNSLVGADGNDTLNGGAGTDTLVGGLGNDTYQVDTATDTLTENAAAGIDTIQTSLTWTLGSNFENLTLTGSSSLNGTGNTLDNYLVGNAGNNSLSGSSGHDTLDGGLGTDTLVGGSGNDTYIVDSATDTLTEGSGAGTDTIQSSISWTLATNFENLTLSGSSAIDGTGNTVNNILTGNANNNVLNGAAGTDTLVGGAGDDTYIVDSTTDTITENSAEGIDIVQSSVTYTLGSNLENLTLGGASSINGTGNTLNNFITGNSGNNSLVGSSGHDTLDGATGTDTLVGGTGDDTYIVNAAGKTLSENASEGIDTVRAGITFTLGNNFENLTLTGSSNLNGTGNGLDNILTGNSGNNSLSGSSGNDTLDGGLGNDSLVGGSGNDVYWVDSTGDTVTENTSEGTDSIYASVSYTLTNNVENLTLTGTSLIDATGNSSNNILTGNNNDNVLNGAAGTDTLIGGLGNDTYVVDSITDTITENASEGIDSIQSSVSFTLSNNFENILLTGAATIDATGNTLDNVLTGNSANNSLSGASGNDTLDGASGIDTLNGGSGNDVYIVDSLTDVLAENSAEGIDTVLSSVSFTLGSNFENLTLTGNSNINATGNIENNIITGNSGNNSLEGLNGVDTLIGGGGNDTYIVDTDTDIIIESSSGGIDTVQSSVTYYLDGNLIVPGNLENLTLTGSNNINANGNTLDNYLMGNAGDNNLFGSQGNDTLNGAAGSDGLFGGQGNDLYIIDSTTDFLFESTNEGIDNVQSSVSYTLNTNFENLILDGAANIDGIGNTSDNNLIGNSGNNVLTANAGNDTLSGGNGVDTLVGGTGSDVYIVDSTTDTITESTNEGIDTVQSSASYTLGSNLENLVLTGSSTINGTGNSLNNALTGNTGNNSLVGSSGNDTLDGGLGTDTLIGGVGNDTYIVDSTADTITENSSEGIDLVRASITYTLGSNLEDLTLSGISNIDGTGNSLDNYLRGNEGNNVLTGGSGSDSLKGGLGIDTLVGGLGDDHYIIDSSTDNIVENSGEGTDTVETTIDYTLDTNIEYLLLAGGAAIDGTGNSLDNIITGNTGDNVINGKAGNDTMIGGAGNDTYYVTDYGDITAENSGEGIDTVYTNLAWMLDPNLENLVLLENAGDMNASGNELNNELTGNAFANYLEGFDGNDTINGGSGGIDTLAGGNGNDLYIINHTGISVYEYSGGGTDSVQSSVSYTMDLEVENLSLTGNSNIDGTGNNFNNVMTGNIGNNVLDGSGGDDTLRGGLGNDTYVIQNYGDTVIENANEGTDTVEVTFGYTLGDQLENLKLLNTAGSINGAGNALNNELTGNDYNNQLSGNDGNDTLIGNAGADTLDGGAGDDTYLFDTAWGIDIITADSSGTDTVDFSSQSIALTVNLTSSGGNEVSQGSNTVNWSSSVIENAITGSGADSITGSSGANRLDGGSGNDTLNGGNGNDILQGGSNNDTYTGFTNATGVDIITDVSGTDTASFTGFNTSAATWTALDTDGDTFVDRLFIDFGSGNSVAIDNYFNNISTDDDLSSQGTGAIETLVFDNDSSVTFTDVLSLIA